MKAAAISTLVFGIIITALASCKNSDTKSAASQATLDSLQAELKKVADDKARVETHLATFDTLDFDVFSNQKWDLLDDSHGQDIVVNWPDGHSTKGLAQHIDDLKAMFVYAPDTKIAVHPIRFGSGEWTCVTGLMNGTFSRPMPVDGGKFIQPTGKHFSIPMCTVARWKDGVMVEESLFWDNQTFMKQIGLAQ